jgi:co-chaperonin GroES (HSP10)
LIVCVGIAAGETIEGELCTSAKELKDKVGGGIVKKVEKDSKEVDAIVIDNKSDDEVEEVVGEGAFGQVNPTKVVSPTIKAGRHVRHQTYEGVFLTQLPISESFERRN